MLLSVYQSFIHCSVGPGGSGFKYQPVGVEFFDFFYLGMGFEISYPRSNPMCDYKEEKSLGGNNFNKRKNTKQVPTYK